MILAHYILRIMAGRIIGALLVLVGILQILDLLEITTKVLDRDLGLAGLGYYAVLRLPRLVEQAAPLAVLAGALFAFAQLAQQSAVVAMRSTGLSVYKLTAMAAPAAVMMLVIHLGVSLFIAPRTDRTLDAWWRSTTPAAEQKVVGPRAFRVGRDIVVAAPGDESGRLLKDVIIYRRDDDGRLLRQIRAEAATFNDGAWILRAPRLQAVGEGGVQKSSATEMSWRSLLRPADVRTMFWGDDSSLAAPAALRALEGGASVRPASYYETQLQRIWAAPLAALVMLIIAAPVTLANFRSGRGAQVLTLCLGAGLLFLVVDGLLTAVGESGAAPAVLAAWAAPAIFAAGGITALLYLEG